MTLHPAALLQVIKIFTFFDFFLVKETRPFYFMKILYISQVVNDQHLWRKEFDQMMTFVKDFYSLFTFKKPMLNVVQSIYGSECSTTSIKKGEIEKTN